MSGYWQQLADRPIYIWGAGAQGRGMCTVLEREGVRILGFIDSSEQLQGTELAGYTIHPPEVLRRSDDVVERPFVIIAAFYHEAPISQRCRSLGLEEGQDFLSYKKLRPYDYVVDVSGRCNLRCMSCPRASRDDRHPPAGMMSLDTFRQVVDKILREDPLLGSIQLYQWGEPLLNPELPQIIEAAVERGVPCAVSSNLSLRHDLEPVIAAGPSWFRVSVSGTREHYEAKHTGASWERLVTNLHRLSELRETLKPDMKTELYYHLYRDNRGEPLDQLRALSQQLGFEFHPVWAYLISLDDVLEYLEGGELSGPALEASNMLALSLDDGMALARKEAHLECPVTRCIHINWDLSVSRCMMFFYPQANVACRDFLTTPLEAIVSARQGALCRRCRAQALHRYCQVYATTDPLAGGGP